MTLAIQKALQQRLREANTQLDALLKGSPQHSILHYNLALTYAQLGDFTNAYEHFLRSYHLDANNYLSGIFAIMSAELAGKENLKLVSIVKDSLSREDSSDQIQLYRTLMEITLNNFMGAGKWIDQKPKENLFSIALSAIIASELKRDDDSLKAIQKLMLRKPAELLPHLMYLNVLNRNKDPKAYASSAMTYMKKHLFSYEDLYFGPKITRDRAIMMAAMTGQLMPIIGNLESKLQTTTENTADITAALAQAYFYNRNFENAYTLYNQLIDTYKIKDEKTLFLGASASIGAQHYQNAIALLELSKLKNPSYLETRYALALLYMQTKNNPAAVSLLTKMRNSGFVSHYFDFSIDTQKLDNEPQKYHPL